MRHLAQEADAATRPGVNGETRHARNETADATHSAIGHGTLERVYHDLLRPRFNLMLPDSVARALHELTADAIDERTRR